MNHLHIIRGVPGSGKSTLAKKQQKELGGIVLEEDDFFSGWDGEYRFRLEHRQLAMDYNYTRAAYYMARRVPRVTVVAVYPFRSELHRFQKLVIDCFPSEYTLSHETVGGQFTSIHDVPDDAMTMFHNLMEYWG